jgi:hypothetical protein
MLNPVEEELIDTANEGLGRRSEKRRKGLREIFAVLGVIPIIGYLFAMHGWISILIFLFVANGLAFGLRFAMQLLPTWVVGFIAVLAVAVPGYSFLWSTAPLN